MVAGSSTGLHHDYHDNLYVLLRGRKRFRLFPPSLADRMYVHGQLQRVHPNGRIVHKSQVRRRLGWEWGACVGIMVMLVMTYGQDPGRH